MTKLPAPSANPEHKFIALCFENFNRVQQISDAFGGAQPAQSKEIRDWIEQLIQV